MTGIDAMHSNRDQHSACLHRGDQKKWRKISPCSIAFHIEIHGMSDTLGGGQLTIQDKIPICSRYGIFTHIWVIFRANVDKYSIDGAYGIRQVSP